MNKKTAAIAAAAATLSGAITYELSQPSAGTVPPPVPVRAVAWNWTTSTGCVYELWTTTNLSRPFVAVNTNLATNQWPFFATNPMAFYRVRARDTNTGTVSPWATTRVQ